MEEENYCVAQTLDCLFMVGEASSSSTEQFSLFEIVDAVFHWTLLVLTTISYIL